MLTDVGVRVTIAGLYRLSTAESPFGAGSIAKLSAGDRLAWQPRQAAAQRYYCAYQQYV